MSDDKRKHKPQQKHTLSEVLKSLQDLIRTDLVPGQSPAKSAAAQPPAPPAADPESFHQALDALDRIITEKIIEPVERAREQPPEPLLPDETLEIAWNDEAGVPAAGGAEPQDAAVPERADEAVEPGAAAAEPGHPGTPERPADVEIVLDDGSADIEVVELEAADGGEGDAVAAEDDVAEPTLEPPDRTAGQQTFSFGEPPPDQADRALSEPPQNAEEEPPVAASQTDGVEIVMLDSDADAAADDAASFDPAADADATEFPQDDGASDDGASAEQRRDPAAESREPQDIPTLTVEYEPAAAGAPGVAPPLAEQESGTHHAMRAFEEHAVTPKPTPEDRAPAQPRPAQDQKAATAPPPARPPAGPDVSSTGARAAGTDIPVLKEIADLDPPPAAPLPDAGQAREIAIRVIAKLNIERRKAGEPQLDIKTIERLQQYLADALTKRALNKPK